ncbi:flagellar motor switch protein FliY [Caminibacter pacificus]|uniref:Flagellar motor switch protein FliN n=1 Tax=Caminibacter pacificus TaxID=1424653 RepID=A0AAJ4RD96_9BACT|nr:flagellar motor switch protein FliY [Caminibacter pacificus]NPA87228.1 flagellar motor switch protein FliY [Campylobacterota bacterium]QCI28681.1 flagellar motor switch protein FliY [Caminibacter pacificus]ROR40588.1 flagellar motor switch protein FliN/FliY [Caminibacter pacificus]
MNEFIEILLNEIKSTIEGLIGITPEINLINHSKNTGTTSPSYVKVSAKVKPKGEIVFIIPPEFATAVTDLMLGGEGEAKSEVNEDDLDAVKEIVSNILGALSTALEAQSDMPDLKFEVGEVTFVSVEEDFEDFGYVINIECKVNDILKSCQVFLDKALYSLIAKEEVQEAAPKEAPSDIAIPEEAKNLEMLLDVKLQLRVRIGSKVMLLKDVINMDIGSIVELNQLANEPLDILIEDKKIGEGEVVIVDGNFGIQITSIGSKADRLKSLKG